MEDEEGNLVNSSIDFSMVNTIIASTFAGFITGSRIAKFIPLLAGWIGALVGAVCMGYATTFHDGRGDMLRFMGWNIVNGCNEVLATMEDVGLQEKTLVLFNLFVSIAKRLDRQFKIVQKLQVVFGYLIGSITSAMQSTNSGGGGGGGGPFGGGGGGRDRRKYSDDQRERTSQYYNEGSNGQRRQNMYADEGEPYVEAESDYANENTGWNAAGGRYSSRNSKVSGDGRQRYSSRR